MGTATYSANQERAARRPSNGHSKSAAEVLECPPLPQNIESERAVLGAILLGTDGGALNIALEKLRPDDFFFDHHRRIFKSMIEMATAQQAIDLVTFTDQLQRVSVLLGHSSLKVTERHYATWVRSRQEQLEADVRRFWQTDPSVPAETKGTLEVHTTKHVVQ